MTDGHSSGVFHRAQVPITKVVVGRDPHGEFYDADPTSPGTDCLTPRRKFAAAAKRRSGQRSFHSESSSKLSPTVSDLQISSKGRLTRLGNQTAHLFQAQLVSVNPMGKAIHNTYCTTVKW